MLASVSWCLGRSWASFFLGPGESLRPLAPRGKHSLFGHRPVSRSIGQCLVHCLPPLSFLPTLGSFHELVGNSGQEALWAQGPVTRSSWLHGSYLGEISGESGAGNQEPAATMRQALD